MTKSSMTTVELLSLPVGHRRIRVTIELEDGSAAPSAILAISHGLGADGAQAGLSHEIAVGLRGLGCAVAHFDYHSHGKDARGWQDFLLSRETAEYRAVLEVLQATWPDAALICCGVSFGAAAAIERASGEDIRGLVLWNPVLDYAGTFDGAATPWAREISSTQNDPSLPDWAYARLPETDVILSRALRAELHGVDSSRLLDAVEVPLFAVHGAADDKVDPTPVDELRGREHTTVRLIAGGRHGLKSARAEVLSDLVPWVRTVISE